MNNTEVTDLLQIHMQRLHETLRFIRHTLMRDLPPSNGKGKSKGKGRGKCPVVFLGPVDDEMLTWENFIVELIEATSEHHVDSAVFNPVIAHGLHAFGISPAEATP
eukprot:5341862-Heterocapsa_arctica.AAC.1